MPVCGIMLCKNEEDVIEYTIRHLLGQVDHIIVADNESTDRTREILDSFPITVVDDPEVGYFQSRKTTALALRAFQEGFNWVLPCDADELWYALDGRTIRDYLDGIAPDVRIAKAELYNHIPTGEDQRGDPNPLTRIRWRLRTSAPIGKVCVRMDKTVVIEQGNHGARYGGHGLAVPGLAVRHFSWRSAEQYLGKIRTGAAAYAATDMDDSVGAHWRMFNGAGDEAVMNHFRDWFYFDEPGIEPSLRLDPAPYVDGSILTLNEGEVVL